MIYLGLSGGMDSVALFMDKVLNNITFKCIHVNHNQSEYDILSQAYCENLCRLWKVELITSQVYATNETNARELRYKEYMKYVSNDDVLLLGHHIDDSVETTLLNILNGTSVFGARGIDSSSTYGDMKMERPFIKGGMSKQNIKKYLIDLNVEWIEDNTNLDLSIKRNYIRHVVVPCLNKLFPNSINKILQFGEQCRKQSKLNDRLAEFSHKIIYSELSGNFYISGYNELSVEEQENWFFWFCRGKKLYLANRHFKEFQNFINNEKYTELKLGNSYFKKDVFVFRLED